MARTGRPKAELTLTVDEREQLQRWARRRTSAQALAMRSRIVLACAQGRSNTAVAGELGVSAQMVGKWRARFVEGRLDGLADDPRPGRPSSITGEKVEDIIVATLESTPANATHWSRAKMAERTGLSKSSIGRIWKAFDLKPHRSDTFKLSNDPLFVEKIFDVVGLYLDPPEGAVVLSVDEKSQVQALARPQPAFPMMPGMPERRTHDYVRHGTTSLFAAFNTADGTVISSLHRRHRTIEFKKFLTKIDATVPAHLHVHLIADNYGTHKTRGSRERQPAQRANQHPVGKSEDHAERSCWDCTGRVVVGADRYSFWSEPVTLFSALARPDRVCLPLAVTASVRPSPLYVVVLREDLPSIRGVIGHGRRDAAPALVRGKCRVG